MPEKQVVTAADSRVDQTPAPVNASPTNATNASIACAVSPLPPGEQVDFKLLRQHVTMEQVLTHLGCLAELRGQAQRRGRCPIHAHPGDRHRSFSVNMEKNMFQCFYPECRAQGNVLDFWAAFHRMPLREAALHLAKTFKLDNRTEEKRNP